MTSAFEAVSVVGLGYIGLPTAATIAARGVMVKGVDINDKAVKTINNGQAHFSEPDLDLVLQSTVQTGKLEAYTEPQPADVFIIAVPTPVDKANGPDLTCVEAAARSVAKVLKSGDLVLLESTSPIGTTEKMCAWMADERGDLKFPHNHKHAFDINVAYCPERILPGRMMFELVQNDRIIGGMTDECSAKAKVLYELFVRGEIFTTKASVAELVKLMENAFRDVNIAFANEISILCDRYDIDVWEAIRLANRHPRVNVLNPGPGVGGHCIAVDPWFLIAAAPDLTPLMMAARNVNDGKPRIVLEKVRKQISRFRQPVVACLGLAFKPDVDDLRESPALEIVEALALDGDADILVVEPNVNELPKTLSGFEHVRKADLEDAIEAADIVVLLAGHKPFRPVEARHLRERVVIDTVGLWSDR